MVTVLGVRLVYNEVTPSIRNLYGYRFSFNERTFVYGQEPAAQVKFPAALPSHCLFSNNFFWGCCSVNFT